MPFLMGHMVGGWLLGRLTQRITRVRFSHLEWGLLLFGSLLPDVDHLFDWIFKTLAHRTFSHSIMFLFVLFAGVYITSQLFKFLNEDMDAKRNAIMITFGAMTHMVLDMALGAPGIGLFWPSMTGVYLFGYSPLYDQSIMQFVLDHPIMAFVNALIDMCIGGAWIGYFFITKRIRF